MCADSTINYFEIGFKTNWQKFCCGIYVAVCSVKRVSSFRNLSLAQTSVFSTWILGYIKWCLDITGINLYCCQDFFYIHRHSQCKINLFLPVGSIYLLEFCKSCIRGHLFGSFLHFPGKFLFSIIRRYLCPKTVLKEDISFSL